MRSLVEREGVQDRVELDSAGTGAWHVGSAPDTRAAAAARARGIELDGTARRVSAEDFEDFDMLLAMDGSNLSDLRLLAPGPQEREKVRLLREFDPAGAGAGNLDVPDPYYGGDGGFEHVLDLVQAACEGLLAEVLRARRLDAAPGSSAAVAVGGGNINAGYRVLLADGAQAFVKTRADVHAGEYEAEAAGLDWLREPGALRTPRVLDRGEGYLALEWIEQGI